MNNKHKIDHAMCDISREKKRTNVKEGTIRYKMCARKTRYKNCKEASIMAKKAIKASGDTNIVAYHCRFCHGWHIGHNKYAKIDKTARPHT